MSYTKQELTDELVENWDCTESYAKKAVELWFEKWSGSGQSVEGDLEVDAERLYDAQEYWE